MKGGAFVRMVMIWNIPPEKWTHFIRGFQQAFQRRTHLLPAPPRTRHPPQPDVQDYLKVLGFWFGGAGACTKTWEERISKLRQKLG
eukprot:g14181.t1